MRRYILLLFLAGILSTSIWAKNMADILKEIPGMEEVTSVQANSFFTESFHVKIRQPIDHKNPSAGTFLQRVFISVKESDAPVVLVTEGYGADYGANVNYINELCPLLDASQVVVEHRYFGPSTPENADWSYLTVENAANDHHRVASLLKPLLGGKWVNTGISKGGQTALLHRVFFPNDVDVTVSYVAPFNFGVEDGRHEPFIAKKAGTKEARKKVKHFQREVLKRRAELMPRFEQHVNEKGYTFSTDLNAIYDYCVLEYSFSFWQWGHDPSIIPSTKSTDDEIFDHFMKIASPDYFSREGLARIGSFFVQAARELGYYGYDTRPFRKYLSISDADDYLAKLFLPDGYSVSFDPTSVLKTREFLKNTDAKMIFIYGANDPWTASGVDLPERAHFLKVVQDGAGHGIRIRSLDEINKLKVMNLLNSWISNEVPVSLN